MCGGASDEGAPRHPRRLALPKVDPWPRPTLPHTGHRVRSKRGAARELLIAQPSAGPEPDMVLTHLCGSFQRHMAFNPQRRNSRRSSPDAGSSFDRFAREDLLNYGSVLRDKQN